jgi:hypothetical protein
MLQLTGAPSIVVVAYSDLLIIGVNAQLDPTARN